jgi:hypothetical protein
MTLVFDRSRPAPGVDRKLSYSRGDPLADLVLALGLSVMTREFQARLLELGLVWTVLFAEGGCLSQLEPSSEVALPPVCYMDDSAIPVAARSRGGPEALLQQSER